MTLKQKLKTEFPINTEKKSNKFANKCVIISQDFAIGFAEYLFNNYINDERHVLENPEQLLEIYKKTL